MPETTKSPFRSRYMDPEQLWDYLSQEEKIVSGHISVPSDTHSLMQRFLPPNEEEERTATQRAAVQQLDWQNARESFPLSQSRLVSDSPTYDRLTASRQLQRGSAEDGRASAFRRVGGRGSVDRLTAPHEEGARVTPGGSSARLLFATGRCLDGAPTSATSAVREAGSSYGIQRGGSASTCSTLPPPGVAGLEHLTPRASTASLGPPPDFLGPPGFPRGWVPLDDLRAMERVPRGALSADAASSAADLRVAAAPPAPESEGWGEEGEVALSADPAVRLQQLRDVERSVLHLPAPRVEPPPLSPRRRFVSTLDDFEAYRQEQKQRARIVVEARGGPRWRQDSFVGPPPSPRPARASWKNPGPTPGLPRGVRGSDAIVRSRRTGRLLSS